MSQLRSKRVCRLALPPRYTRARDEAHAMLARLRRSGEAGSAGGVLEVESPVPLPWGGRALPEDTSAPKLLLRVEEAAQLLSLSRKTIYDLLRRGELASLKIGGSRRIPTAALQDLIARLEAA